MRASAYLKDPKSMAVFFGPSITACPDCYAQQGAIVMVWTQQWRTDTYVQLPNGERFFPEKAGKITWCSVCKWSEVKHED